MEENIEVKINHFNQSIQKLHNEIGKLIVGNSEIIEGVIFCLLARGHALLEGVPGLGKTLLVKTMSQVLDISFSRIQFTPDLMPADIIGTNIVGEDNQGHRSFQFHRGPVFANILLADEINRATPKTQSALLEAMQEKTVTCTGIKHSLPEPFLVLATQNPIEMEGTYPLPEAQLDRFLFKLIVDFPSLDELVEIIRRTTGKEEPSPEKILHCDEIIKMRKLVREVLLSEKIEHYVGKLILATHPQSPCAGEKTNRYVLYGSSPRGAQAIILTAKIRALLDNRCNVSFSDVKSVARPSLRHRIILNFEGQAEGVKTDDIIEEILLEILE